MANTKNFPNTGKKKKPRTARLCNNYKKLLTLLSKHRFRFTVEPLAEPMAIDGEWDSDRQQYTQVTLDTLVTITGDDPGQYVKVYTSPSTDALIDPGADTGEYMDAHEVLTWAYNNIRGKELAYGEG